MKSIAFFSSIFLSGALYKRGEDGMVLVNQNVCRGWRFGVTACP
ncbi:hypothetical protein SPLC1_S101960 [Arthrospira platensis C1]|nr:hypothetical protein SPLC1_S101960 [Arthrospira platensis C1]RAQ49154.1 transcriptional regulator [Arthrospira sp. O9.13F]